MPKTCTELNSLKFGEDGILRVCIDYNNKKSKKKVSKKKKSIKEVSKKKKSKKKKVSKKLIAAVDLKGDPGTIFYIIEKEKEIWRKLLSTQFRLFGRGRSSENPLQYQDYIIEDIRSFSFEQFINRVNELYDIDYRPLITDEETKFKNLCSQLMFNSEYQLIKLDDKKVQLNKIRKILKEAKKNVRRIGSITTIPIGILTNYKEMINILIKYPSCRIPFIKIIGNIGEKFPIRNNQTNMERVFFKKDGNTYISLIGLCYLFAPMTLNTLTRQKSETFISNLGKIKIYKIIMKFITTGFNFFDRTDTLNSLDTVVDLIHNLRTNNIPKKLDNSLAEISLNFVPQPRFRGGEIKYKINYEATPDILDDNSLKLSSQLIILKGGTKKHKINY